MPKKKDYSESEILANIAVHGMQEKKAKEVVLLDMREIHGTVFDFFAICHGTSPAQVEAIADSVDREIKKATGQNPWRTEGYLSAEWIVLDYINIVVHVFLDKSRDFYRLESLWADAKKTTFDNVE